MFTLLCNVSYAQSGTIITKYGDSLSCESIEGNRCFNGGEEQTKFDRKEIIQSIVDGELHIFEDGFDRGEVIMANEKYYFTHFKFTTMRHKKEHVNNHFFFVDRKTLEVKQEYQDWYLDRSQTIVKYFPVDTTECPKYGMAIKDYEKACSERTKIPSAEGRAVIRTWNECYPLKID